MLLTRDSADSGKTSSAFANAWQQLKRFAIGSNHLRKVIFVSYGVFDCNSAVHIAGFANELVGMGYRVAVGATGGMDKAYAFGRPSFEFFDTSDLSSHPDRILGFDGKLSLGQTLLYCWTPRPIVRTAVSPIVKTYGLPYVVHLEDNEVHLAEVLGSTDKDDVNHAWFDDFISRSAGVTVIEPRLSEMLPRSVPVMVLEPGVDHEQFGRELGRFRKQTIRGAIGVPMDATMIVYTGNVHPANLDEMRPLYEALQALRQRSHNIFMVRTGTDYVSADFLEKARPENGVISLGQVERSFLIELLKCSDLFIQPGRPGPFNDYRLPSKIPEFMAVGRPVILPRSNVGLQLRHGEDALLLELGTADEIARHVETILADSALAGRLAANAKAFAVRRYQWKQQGQKLSQFLRRVFPTGRQCA